MNQKKIDNLKSMISFFEKQLSLARASKNTERQKQIQTNINNKNQQIENLQNLI